MTCEPTDDGEDESVAEVSVQRQFDDVPPQTNETRRVHEPFHYVNHTHSQGLLRE